jgi:hypothetical protein
MSKQDTQFAKVQLRNHLSTVLVPHIQEGIWSIYENAKTVCERNKEVDQTLMTFQNLLTRVATWTEDTLEQEVKRIIQASKCEYIEDLLTGVFLSYMRAFAAVQFRPSHDVVEIEFEKPSLNKFIHELYKQVARGAWKNAYLFKTYSISSEQQARNRKDIVVLVEESLDTVIDSFLPWKDITKSYFQAQENARVSGPAEEDDEDEDEEEKPKEEEEKPRVRFDTPIPKLEEEEEPPKLKLEEAPVPISLDIASLDEDNPVKKEEEAEKVEVTVPTTSDSLVLNL